MNIELTNKTILVKGGAMGTMLQAYKFTEEDFRGERFKDYPTPLQGNNDLLSITQPEAIKTIHGKYFEAGADIVETNTFSGTTIAMADYQIEDLFYELNYQSAKIAKEVAAEFTAKEPHKPRFVAGSIGPTNRTASSFAVNSDKLGVINLQNKLPVGRSSRNMQMYGAMYGEVIKNKETVEFMLKTSTPSLEVLDTPFAPLEPQKRGTVLMLVLGCIAGLVLSVGWFAVRIFLKKMTAE